MEEIEVAAAMLLTTVCVVAAWLWAWRARQKKQYPFLNVWPLLGVSLELVANYPTMHEWLLHKFKANERATGAKTFTAPMPGFNYVYTVDPEVVEHVLKTNFANYPKGEKFHEIMEILLGDGIFNSDGEVWRRQRKTASFEFASKILRDFSTNVFRDYAIKLASIVDGFQGKSFDMQDLLMRMTLESIGKLGFGVEIGCLAPSLPENKFAVAFDNANEWVTNRFVDPFWKLCYNLKIGREGQLDKCAKVVNDFTYNVIRARREELKAPGNAERKADILSRFMVLGEDPTNQIDDKMLRDVVLNFVIAGRDTTAVTLSWFIYMMATHPAEADKLYDELRLFEEEEKRTSDTNQQDADGDDLNTKLEEFGKLLTFDSLAKLLHVHAALTETLRLFPAVPEDIKGILADDTLPDGRKVRAGDQINYVPWCMGRMESLWGPDAAEYKPDRWVKDGIFQPVSPFKFTAFQAGPRICLGKDSAYLQMKMTAAILCRFFKFEVVPGHVVKYRMMAILSIANGLRLTATLRP